MVSYLWEAGFSAVAGIKKQAPCENQWEQEMRVEVSDLIPSFGKLGSAPQVHTPHWPPPLLVIE